MDNPGLQVNEGSQATAVNQRKQSRARQDSSVDLWATIDRSRLEQDVHIIPLEDLYQRFHTDPRTGLATGYVADARAQYGENKLTPPKQPSYGWLLFKELFMGFNCILWFAGVLAFLAYKPFGEPNPSVTNLALGVVLFLVITCNSILNVYQQLKSIKIVASFSKLLPTLATVRRDGHEQQVVTSELVPGDIILIRMGDKLPADCRIIQCDGLKINTSELTGESKPISATTRCTSANFMESTNIGFYSSMVEQGTGEAVVIATGDSSVLGKMSKLTRGESGDEVTGLHREVNRFVMFVVLATLIGIIILWITWAAWLNRAHHTFVTYNANIVNSIGMIVGFLPMGLPSAVTLGRRSTTDAETNARQESSTLSTDTYAHRLPFNSSVDHRRQADVSTTSACQKSSDCRNFQLRLGHCHGQDRHSDAEQNDRDTHPVGQAWRVQGAHGSARACEGRDVHTDDSPSLNGRSGHRTSTLGRCSDYDATIVLRQHQSTAANVRVQ